MDLGDWHCMISQLWFDIVFLTWGGENKQFGKEISWNELSLTYFDPCIKQCELEV